MDKHNTQRKSSLTTFNFEIPEHNTNEEGVLSKIFDKVISAVSGQPLLQDNASVRTLNDRRQSIISSRESNHSRGKYNKRDIFIFSFYMSHASIENSRFN
jgi:hypothetical protein